MFTFQVLLQYSVHVSTKFGNLSIKLLYGRKEFIKPSYMNKLYTKTILR